MKAEGFRNLVWTGSAVLVATALFHATGYSSAAGAAGTEGLSPFIASALRPLWLLPTSHWIVVALIAAVVARQPGRTTWVVLWCLALLLAIDAILMWIFIGPFVGEALLAASSIAFAVGGRGLGRV